jgi:transposase-like protein
MLTLNKSSIEVLNDVGLYQEEEEALFKKNCPHCYSEKVKIHSHYQTKDNGERKMFICQECRSCFAETYGSVIAGLETPLSEIVKVLKARMEGMGLNAATRVFGYAKTTILDLLHKYYMLRCEVN